jgi:hypothetical protein
MTGIMAPVVLPLLPLLLRTPVRSNTGRVFLKVARLLTMSLLRVSRLCLTIANRVKVVAVVELVI